MIILCERSGWVGRFLGRNNKNRAYFLVVLLGNDCEQSCFFLFSVRQELTNIVSTISVGWWNRISHHSNQHVHLSGSWFIFPFTVVHVILYDPRKKCVTWSWPVLERFQDDGTDRDHLSPGKRKILDPNLLKNCIIFFFIVNFSNLFSVRNLIYYQFNCTLYIFSFGKLVTYIDRVRLNHQT